MTKKLQMQRRRKSIPEVTRQRLINTFNSVPVKTYWNGEQCKARRVIAVVGRADKPTYWFADLEGTEREVVEITCADQAGVQTFYIDNDLWEEHNDTDSNGMLRSGWLKVTVGHGGPSWGHRMIQVERVVREVT